VHAQMLKMRLELVTFQAFEGDTGLHLRRVLKPKLETNSLVFQH
jgi:hypothetical protein